MITTAVYHTFINEAFSDESALIHNLLGRQADIVEACRIPGGSANCDLRVVMAKILQAHSYKMPFYKLV